MARAVSLALTAGSEVSPNPAVGAVLVAGGRIIGEGVTAADGGPHAEVRAVRAVAVADRELLAGATAYVTLEPCSVHGRTPPCCDMLVRERLGRVVVGCVDFTPGVCGRGLERLRLGGVEVSVGCLQEACFELSRYRQATTRARRPYVILKQARDARGTVGDRAGQVAITGPAANVVSHRWRASVDVIVVGATTVAVDDPSLTVRHVGGGAQPARLVFDPRGRCSPAAAAFDERAPSLWAVDANRLPGVAVPEHVRTIPLVPGARVASLLASLQAHRYGRVLVEGGPTTLRGFVDAGAWDEYREWASSKVALSGTDPVSAVDVGGVAIGSYAVGADRLTVYRATPPL